jgi:23S rRNA pseudouridine2605 synthase
MRLAKFLAAAGVSSRRGAEQMIRAGRVSVGGERVLDPGRDVDPADGIKFDGTPVPPRPPRVVYVLNKPAGVVSTARDPRGRPTVVSLIDSPLRLYPVGRLDIDVTGLILLTNDGDLAHRLTHPSFEVPRTYRARVSKPPVRDGALAMLRTGVVLEDGKTAPARVRRLHDSSIEITIHEGRKRQVKRMFEHVGHPVHELERVAFGPLALGELRPGAYRKLGERELRALMSAAGSGSRRGAGSSSGARRPPSQG